MKKVRVNRALVRIRPSGRVGDSGRDTFTKNKKNKKQMKSKQKELNEHPGTGSDPPIGSDRNGVLHIFSTFHSSFPSSSFPFSPSSHTAPLFNRSAVATSTPVVSTAAATIDADSPKVAVAAPSPLNLEANKEKSDIAFVAASLDFIVVEPL